MMARLQLDQDLFSPIRFESSFANSSNNSEGSTSNVELSSFMNSPKNEHSLLGLKLNEQGSDSIPNFGNFVQNIKLNESESSNCDSKVLSQNSSTDTFNLTRSLDSKVQNLYEQSSRHKGIPKENSKTFKDKRVVSQLKENVVEDSTKSLDSCEQNDLKIERPPRPTSLKLSKDKQTESATLKENKKKDKIFRKSTSSKNICKKETDKESSVDTTQKNRQLRKHSVNAEKNLKAMKSEHLSAEQVNRKHQVPEKDFESVKRKSLTQQLSHSGSASNLPLHSQYEVSVEKMVHDYISFECDKIRQNMYTQQMYFYRQLNKIKDEMEQKHVASTERIYKVIEKLMLVDVAEENLPAS